MSIIKFLFHKRCFLSNAHGQQFVKIVMLCYRINSYVLYFIHTVKQLQVNTSTLFFNIYIERSPVRHLYKTPEVF